MNTIDPYLLPQTSFGNRAARALWAVVYRLLFRPSPRPLHAWRVLLLRCFGARIGRNCHVYPRARIWAPWNLQCGDVVAIADDAEIYNAWPVTLDSYAIISQQAWLCTATHDVDDAAFPMIGAAIHIRSRAWVCGRAVVMPGVTLQEGVVLGAGAVATRELAAWSVYGGIPARRLRERKQVHA